MSQSRQWRNRRRTGPSIVVRRRKIEAAFRAALTRRYGAGHYGTIATHMQRLQSWATYLRSVGIAQLGNATPDLVPDYVEWLMHERPLAIATVANKVSAVNVVMDAYLGGRWERVSPALVAGRRTRYRTTPPASLDTSLVELALQALVTISPRARVAAKLCYTVGVRIREAILADLDRWVSEALAVKSIQVSDGTKGGRSAPRRVPVGGAELDVLIEATLHRPRGSRNLLAESERYVDWLHSDYRHGLSALQAVGVPGYHDLRAGYGCRRFTKLTRLQPPCVDATTAWTPEVAAAVDQIVHELGHARREIAGPYIGTFIRPPA